MLTSLRVKKACIERLKRCLEVDSVLGRLMPWLVARESYAKIKPNRNKGLSMVGKMKFALRKLFVNGLFMRKASVLKANKYREK
jgi:hypothetical protein